MPAASLLLVLTALFTAVVAAASLTWPFAWDPGIFSWVADTIRHGGLPYRDAWDAKGPLAYYLYAWLQRSGPAIVPVRIFDLLIVIETIQVVLLGITAMVVAALSDSAYALIVGGAGQRISRRHMRWLSRAGGACLIGGGVWLALSRSR